MGARAASKAHGRQTFTVVAMRFRGDRMVVRATQWSIPARNGCGNDRFWKNKAPPDGSAPKSGPQYLPMRAAGAPASSEFTATSRADSGLRPSRRIPSAVDADTQYFDAQFTI